MRLIFTMCLALGLSCGPEANAESSVGVSVTHLPTALTGTISCPVLVVGGSTAAAVAALSAAREGATVCLAQPTSRLGGQYTDQALPAPDEGPIGKQVGDDKAYSKAQASFRARLRALSAGKTNPGACWVSPLCTSVATAKQAFDEALSGFVSSGKLRILSRVTPKAVTTASVSGRTKITAVEFNDNANGTTFVATAAVVVEATDLGDLLELAGVPSRVGQEARADTGEAPLPTAACPRCQQAFTFGVLAEKTAGAANKVPAPAGFGTSPWVSQYTDTYWSTSATGTTPRSFYGAYSIFNYRRLKSSSSSVGSAPVTGDIATLNWGCQPQGPAGSAIRCGNDYGGGPLVGVSASERALHLSRGRDRAQGYLRFLQDGAAPDLAARADLSGAAHGVAVAPYIREARRGVALTTVTWADITAALRPNDARARQYTDSVGIGDYFYMDTHPNDEPGNVALSGDNGKTKPFTIPAGALVPVNTDGLVLSSKSIGTTHLTNAAYRMHPIEWAIGEASGLLAAQAVAKNLNPRDIVTGTNVRRMQAALASRGVPMTWFDDLSSADADFAAIHLMAGAQIFGPDTNTSLHFSPEGIANRAQAAAALVGAMQWPLVNPATASFTDVPTTFWAYRAIETLKARGVLPTTTTFAPSTAVTHQDLKSWLNSAAGTTLANSAFAGIAIDLSGTKRREVARSLAIVYRSTLSIP
jgi:FAD dependent oxidoreductase/S-layer homology domain